MRNFIFIILICEHFGWWNIYILSSNNHSLTIPGIFYLRCIHLYCFPHMLWQTQALSNIQNSTPAASEKSSWNNGPSVQQNLNFSQYNPMSSQLFSLQTLQKGGVQRCGFRVLAQTRAGECSTWHAIRGIRREFFIAGLTESGILSRACRRRRYAGTRKNASRLCIIYSI